MKFTNSPQDVVVTGAGVCCNMGDDSAEIKSHLRNGKPSTFERWQPAIDYGARCHLSGRYHGDISNAALGVTKKQGRFMGTPSRYALRAARIAIAQANIDPRELAVVVGSGTGDVDTHRTVYDVLGKTSKATKIPPTVVPRLMASTVSANLVHVLCSTGPSFTATAACAGGTYNVLLAAQLIKSGHAKCAIAGGVETLDLHFYSGFDSMRAFNSGDNEDPSRASRPYAADRAGFILGEGSGILVLETRASAEARGAKILGAIRGFGMSSDGSGEMVAPSSDGAFRSMKQALENAGCSPDDIDYINTHGTSTPLGDVTEVRAIRKLFGDRKVTYSSTKGYTGHAVSGAGAIEAIFALWMLDEGWLAPSIHAAPVDPEIADYPPLMEPTDRQCHIALSNSLGFGGTNATLILSN